VLAHGRIDFDVNMSRFTEKLFSRHYWLSKSDFLAVVDEISPTISRTHSRPVGSADSLYPQVILAVTMRYLAGGQAMDLGWPFGFADSTANQEIDKSLEAFNRHLKNIHFPRQKQTVMEKQLHPCDFTTRRCATSSLSLTASLACVALDFHDESRGQDVGQTRESITIARASVPFASKRASLRRTRVPSSPPCTPARRMILRHSCLHRFTRTCPSRNWTVALPPGVTSLLTTRTVMSTPFYTHLSKSELDVGTPAWCHLAADNA
jgi:hypothetical protein